MNDQTIPHLLKLMFATFPPQAGDVEAQIAAFGLALEGHDPRDIQAAITRFIRGEVEGHNPSFAPSSALLGAEVRRRMDARLDSERRANPPRTLPPPDIDKSPESRERVKAMLASIGAPLPDMRTSDAKVSAKDPDLTARTNARFDPSQEPAPMKYRLNIGDPHADGDMEQERWG